MVTRIIKSETDLALLVAYLRQRKRPYTVDVVSGKHRSVEQNKLQRLWVNEIAEQLGDQTPEEVRGFCKLTLGVPILRAENTEFREKYDRIIRPMPYEQKLECMMEPLDFPVTRIMTTVQKTSYLEAIARHFCPMGIVLTDPENKQGGLYVASNAKQNATDLGKGGAGRVPVPAGEMA